MFNALCLFFFKLFGWKLVGTIPASFKKGILIVCPHKTWIDFLIGLGSRAAMNLKISYLGKKELFDNKWFGWFFYKTGGHPVNRFAHSNAVDAVAEIFNKQDDLIIAMAPEGTRKNVDKLRTGFYYIALTAKIPILFIAFDFENKEVQIHNEPFWPTGNLTADLKTIAQHYQTVPGCNKDWVRNYLEGRG